ncbi:MAG: HD-GYP domain-containing protein [Coriobacteriia bacterium]|nr:HD-GYP domain-containing protein [Coriobacteriia bacterium]
MSRDLRFRAFYVCLVAATLTAVYLVARSSMRPPPFELVVLGLLTVGAEIYSVAVENGASASLSYPLSIAAIVLLGPAGGALTAAVSTLPTIQTGTPGYWRKLTFNACQVTLSAVLSGWVFIWLGGSPLLVVGALGETIRRPLDSTSFASILVPFGAMILVSMVLNYVLVITYFVLQGEWTIRQAWRSIFAWLTPTQVALGILGLTIAQIVAVVGVPGLALFVAPLLVARETYNRYIRLREAYADTVRSLVGAIEAKDPYTKGHSVRVASYAVKIARRLGMDDGEVERVEYAALLHDLGKVGVSRVLLSKTQSLTADEFAEVRRHPMIGADIVQSVPYLSDLAPAIEHHHERIDGRGYGEGLSGDSIPLSSRILAVADSYDAMTSVRPYRIARPVADAVEELVSAAGSQFDSSAVQALVDVLAEDLDLEMTAPRHGESLA